MINISKLLNYNQIEVEPTNRCNYACKICPRPDIKTGFMNLETFIKIFLEKPLPKNIKAIYFTGYGEPLLNQNTPTFIKLLKEKHPEIDLILVTNGSLLTEKIARKILTSGLTKLRVSFLMQGTNFKTYRTNMNGIRPEIVITNVERLVKLKKETLSKTKIIIKNVRLLNYTDKDVNEYRDFWMKKGVDYVKISNVQSRAGNLHCKFRYLNTNQCMLYDTVFFIAWNGDAHPCCNDIWKHYRLGSHINMSFKELVDHKKTIKSEMMASDMCQSCDAEIRINLYKRMDSLFLRFQFNTLKHSKIGIKIANVLEHFKLFQDNHP